MLPPIRLHGSPLNYRLRSRLHCDENGRPGFYELRSHTVVPIVPECEVVGPLLRGAIERDEIRGEPGTDILFLENEHTLIRSDVDGPAASLPIEVRGHEMDVAVDSFFQVNRHLLGLLVDLVSGHASSTTSTNRALDLYGGAGFFAIPLARHFQSIVTVESDSKGHELALGNIVGLPVQAVHSDVLEYLKRETQRPDFAFVDPPRSGVHHSVIDELDRLSPEVISYLSCDPVHLARDLARFSERGWEVVTIDLIDLFPNTHHIETLVSLIRGESAVLPSAHLDRRDAVA